MTSKEPKISSERDGHGADPPPVLDETVAADGAMSSTDAAPRVATSGRYKTVSVVRSNLGRLGRIVRVLTKHGFHQFIPERGLVRFLGDRFIGRDDEDIRGVDRPAMAARRFRKVLEELGPTFIKLGQVLSTRPDVLPVEFVRELEKLQDDAPAIPFAEIRTQVELTLGQTLEEAYASVEIEPLASASMAQVHVARTHEGDDVVIKVIRPGIEAMIAADLDLLHLMARLLEATFAEMELYAPGELVDTFDQALRRELDLEAEAAVIAEFALNMADLEGIAVPKVYPHLCGKEVITMERLRGVKLSAVPRGGDEAQRMIKLGLATTFRQVFEVGLFHGDPHPGNLLYLDDGRLGLIDFGMVGRLTPDQQDTIINLVISVVSGDIDGIARVVLKMGRPLGRIDLSLLKDRIRQIRKEHLKGKISEVNASKFVQDLLDAGQQFRLRIAPEYAILAKASVTIEGVLRALAPDLDIMTTARPYAKALLKNRYSPKRLLETSLSAGLTFASLLKEVPQHLDQVMLDLKTGTMTFEVRNKGLDEVGSHLNILTTRLFMAVLASGLFIASAIMIKDDPLTLFGSFPLATFMSMLVGIFLSVVGLAWHAIAAGSGKLSLNFLAGLVKRRQQVSNDRR